MRYLDNREKSNEMYVKDMNVRAVAEENEV